MKQSVCMRNRLYYIFFSILTVVLVCIACPAYAADPKPNIKDGAYAAKYVSQNIPDPITIEAGQTKTVEVTFKNVGTATWYRKGGRHISAYTEVPRHRLSEFSGANWVSKEQTALMQPAEVPPGGTGTITIELKAPNKPGTYKEEFYLAAENYTWVKGGYFFLSIIVMPSKEAVGTTSSEIQSEKGETSSTLNLPVAIDAKRTILNTKQVSVSGGEEVKIILGIKNTGASAWNTYGLVASQPTAIAGQNNLTFADASWQSNSLIFEKKKAVAPNENSRETFVFRAPAKKGTYTLSLAPFVNGEVVNKELASIEVTVTSDAPSHYAAPVFKEQTPAFVPEIPRLEAEPSIRVGLWKDPEESVQFRSLDDDYYIYNDQIQVGVLSAKELATLSYQEKNKTFTFVSNAHTFTTSGFIRLTPVNNKRSTFMLLNYKRRVSWRGELNFNKYHGGIEYRKTADEKARYIINDLLFEDYVAGIAEASDASPVEFLKAQSIVARTYAYYVTAYTDKYEKSFFDVVASTGDQLYLGANNEALTPNYIKATTETRGKMVTYNEEVVITPYFGNSNGKTKSWTEAWGGTAKPWLVSVEAKYDSGRSYYGHGVGMSQRDAALRAEKEKSSFEELVKHYYTGVEIDLIYK